MTKILKGIWAIAALVGAVPLKSYAYPLDMFKETGMHRLEGYYNAVKANSPDQELPPGAWLKAEGITLNLEGIPFAVPPKDPQFSRQLVSILGSNASRISLGVIDISDPKHPRYGGVDEQRPVEPGSVGKIVVALTFFQLLADRFPKVEDRIALMHDRLITANEFIIKDKHEVPFWLKEDQTGGHIELRPLEEGDTANLWTYLDWMLSASSNAAASMVMRELVLMKGLGNRYPPTEEEEENFFSSTSAAKLGSFLSSSIDSALTRNGINPGRLRQGSLFTSTGKQKIPGSGSTATVSELLRYMVLMEQGRLVDQFSSLEIKRLLYLTQARSRFASAPELKDAAVYIKSGSMYACVPERGYVCEDFKGNVKNMMTAVAVIESSAKFPRKRYLVAISSNVLRVNAAELHAAIAGRLETLMESK